MGRWGKRRGNKTGGGSTSDDRTYKQGVHTPFDWITSIGPCAAGTCQDAVGLIGPDVASAEPMHPFIVASMIRTVYASKGATKWKGNGRKRTRFIGWERDFGGLQVSFRSY